MTQTVAKKQNPNQMLSYDTTFCLGEFYVPPLLFRHTMFEENPVMPVLFMFHERKYQAYHEYLFKIMNKFMTKTEQGRASVLTDSEAGIVGAIETQTNFTHLFCWRHLFKDIHDWIDKHLGTRQDRKVLDDEVTWLFQRDSREEFHEQLAHLQLDWSPLFVQHFREKLLQKFEMVAKWAVQPKVPHSDTQFGVTTNQSEGFNFLLKSICDWTVAPLNCILLSFKMLQRFYLNEVLRGKMGIGTYTLWKVWKWEVRCMSNYIGFCLPTRRHHWCHQNWKHQKHWTIRRRNKYIF